MFLFFCIQNLARYLLFIKNKKVMTWVAFDAAGFAMSTDLQNIIGGNLTGLIATLMKWLPWILGASVAIPAISWFFSFAGTKIRGVFSA